MNNLINHLPKRIKVEIMRGESGALLARLPKYDVFTESNTLKDLYLQVNDLIYTYFDIPKKYQKDINFIPTKTGKKELLKISKESSRIRNSGRFMVRSLQSSRIGAI